MILWMTSEKVSNTATKNKTNYLIFRAKAVLDDKTAFILLTYLYKYFRISTSRDSFQSRISIVLFCELLYGANYNPNSK